MRTGKVLADVQSESWGRGVVYGSASTTSGTGMKDSDSSDSVAPQTASVIPEEVVSEVLEEAATGTEKYTLPYFKSSLYASLLEDSITELRILVDCNTEMRITKTMADMNLLLALKYGVEQPKITDELDGINHHKLGCLEYKLNKLDADRKYFGDVITDTYIDLVLRKSYGALVDHIRRVIDTFDYRIYIQEEELKNKNLRRELSKQLRLQRNHIKSVTYDNDLIIDKLKRGVEDAALNAEIRSRYIENWQRARTEQHLQTIHDKESGPSDSIEEYKQRLDHEQRVHTEVELLINIAINETLNEVERWMDKYDKDMEAIDLKIQIRKNEYQNMLERRIKLQETIVKHDEQMKAWIKFKDDREEARKYREKMTKSAIIVQAWWRGLLVRQQLGPYKVKKKPGAGKKKK